MRKGYSNRLWFDNTPIEQVKLNPKSRDRMVSVLRVLQQAYVDRELADRILGLVAADIDDNTQTDNERSVMDCWHIVVLAAVWLRCKLTYDRLQDLAENHRNLRAIMGLGDGDEMEFNERTICDNLSLLKPETIAEIRHLIAGEGHQI